LGASTLRGCPRHRHSHSCSLVLPRPAPSLPRPLQAFEESLAAHSNELELKKGLLQKVAKSREDELAALSRMQGDVKRQL